MKKQLLFIFIFLKTIFIVSAQSNTLTFTGNGNSATTETFLFGTDANVYALSGTDFNNVAGFISYNVEVTSGNPVSENMGINTSGSNVNATLTFRYRKKAANTATVTILIPGQTDMSYALPDTSVDDGGVDILRNKDLEYTTVIPLSSTVTNVTFRIDEMAQNGATDIRFRIYDVKVNGQVTLSIEDVDAQAIKITTYPNPATNSFQIGSNKSIENVKLYNITGRLLKTFNERVHYDISDLAAGIYIANIKTDLGSKVLRLVKK
ncbi:MAG: T9SS type A sorting domain-containing protein [Algibacter sp.]